MLKQMKNKSLTFVAAALLTVGGAGVAFAHGKGGDGAGEARERRPDDAAAKKEHEAHRAEMLAKYDANKDGKLDDAERKTMRDDRLATQFQAMDKNGDGKLSLDEYKAGAPNGFRHGRHGRLHHRGMKP